MFRAGEQMNYCPGYVRDWRGAGDGPSQPLQTEQFATT